MSDYTASQDRYEKLAARRCGKSGLILPEVSLGLWHNFGSIDDYSNARNMLRTAFDLGVFHFDLANNYGPEPGSAEENFGKIFTSDFKKYRDELILSTKAGYRMWSGPFGEWGSRKSLIASCDQSLKRMQVDYVDIFYHHRPDPDTPIEESMLALDHIVRSGRALYVGLSNYEPAAAEQAFSILSELKTPAVIYQGRYNMLGRNWESNGMFDMLRRTHKGAICFSPLAQGILSSRYLHGIPENSRAVRNHFLKESSITPELLAKLNLLAGIARQRGQTLSQMALAWILSRKEVTSVLCGASSPEQIAETVKAPFNTHFTCDELERIDAIVIG